MQPLGRFDAFREPRSRSATEPTLQQFVKEDERERAKNTGDVVVSRRGGLRGLSVDHQEPQTAPRTDNSGCLAHDSQEPTARSGRIDAADERRDGRWTSPNAQRLARPERLAQPGPSDHPRPSHSRIGRRGRNARPAALTRPACGTDNRLGRAHSAAASQCNAGSAGVWFAGRRGARTAARCRND